MTQIYSSIDLTQIPANTAGNYLDSNEADDQLGGALSGVLAKTITTVDVTLTDVEADYHLRFELSGTMDAPHNLIVPLTKKSYVIVNGATHDVTVKTASGTGVTVAAAASARLWCDGVNVIEDVGGGAGAVDASAVTFTPATMGNWSGSADPGNVDGALDQLAGRVETLESSGGPDTDDASTTTYTPADNTKWSGSADPGNVDGALDQLASRVKTIEGVASGFYDLHGCYLGAPIANTSLLLTVLPRAVTLPASLTGSEGYAETTAAADRTLSIRKNGVEFATMLFAAGSSTASFTSAAGATFAAGDVLTIVGPSAEDTTLSNIAWCLKGTT